MASQNGFRGLPVNGGTAREIAEVVNRMLTGGLNNSGSVTLAAGVSATVVGDPRVSGSSTILLWPTTTNAAAELGAGTIHTSAKAKGGFTLTHANNGLTDRKFDYAILG
ncbi:MAG TPA: hypothetical protein VMT98_00725 [Verrucomicrobiae bacterium]|nr:hypothetical protein [Verrucomicrobiae bacterium]